ncbi:hypothetical protein GUJ93_ZPchr0008g12945 [Zizania palustris]|uniref:Uncharacterized protein n=1 Tax=Zizania palustris TaxID=103762 RepID=A0A8J5RK27_ZIZPA|nr:hypothetical protein GUJ93_ZPchr0008g12945 [Zizania palustris]
MILFLTSTTLGYLLVNWNDMTYYVIHKENIFKRAGDGYWSFDPARQDRFVQRWVDALTDARVTHELGASGSLTGHRLLNMTKDLLQKKEHEKMYQNGKKRGKARGGGRVCRGGTRLVCLPGTGYRVHRSVHPEPFSLLYTCSLLVDLYFAYALLHGPVMSKEKVLKNREEDLKIRVCPLIPLLPYSLELIDLTFCHFYEEIPCVQ